MKKSVIKGFGYYVPEKVVTNDDLAKLMSTNDEWITERTGIKQRHYRKNINDAEETTAYLGLQASKKAIESAGLTAKDILHRICNPFSGLLFSGMWSSVTGYAGM